jgi:predicted RND superfamily exporter protein
MSDTQYVDLSRNIETVCGQALQRALAAYPAEGPRDVTQTLTGVVPLFMATQDELLTSLWNSFLLASLTIGAAMMVQLRSITAGLLAMLPNVTPIAVVFGLAAWSGVALDIGTIVTASIAMGIAVDGTLHMINWFDQRLRQGLNRKEAAIEAVVHCGPAMWQTGLIVCAGMFVLWPSELVLISRFGVFMSAVVFTASVADTIFTPALLAGPLGWVLERRLRRLGAAQSVALALPVHGASKGTGTASGTQP